MGSSTPDGAVLRRADSSRRGYSSTGRMSCWPNASGQALGHGAPVLQDVADAGGDADVVLQDAEGSCGVADHVDAGDVHPHAAGRLEAVDLRGGSARWW